MMRIIANPLYDQLTIARAASIRKLSPSDYVLNPQQLNRTRQNTAITPLKSENQEHTEITTFQSPEGTSNSRPLSKFVSRPSKTSFRLPTPSTPRPSTPRRVQSSVRPRTSVRPSAHSIQQLPTTTSTTNNRIADGTIRYVSSRHGFEVQRYASNNWLTIDVFAKDACQGQEKTFREMLEKKRQYERLSKSIYSSDYYGKRWEELLQSRKNGLLTHAEWAQQSYKLLCLKTLYDRAAEREQRDIDLDARDVRRVRARSAYKEWKETKAEKNVERHGIPMSTAGSRLTAETPSFLSNLSYSNPPSNIVDETNTTQRMSISTTGDSELQRLSAYQRSNPSKKTSSTTRTTKALDMLDERRWSLQAMLKRVVGLAEPLPPPPKFIGQKQSPLTMSSSDSGFESSA